MPEIVIAGDATNGARVASVITEEVHNHNGNVSLEFLLDTFGYVIGDQRRNSFLVALLRPIHRTNE